MPFFTYRVTAIVWTSGGSGKQWTGDVTIGERADSSFGMTLLRNAVAEQAKQWLRDQEFSPSGQVDLTQWARREE